VVWPDRRASWPSGLNKNPPRIPVLGAGETRKIGEGSEVTLVLYLSRKLGKK